MLTYEASAPSSASPEAAWRVWTDVSGWSANDAIESARIDGEFRTGAVIKSKAKGFPTSTLTVTHVESPYRWADESRSPGLRMTFEHIVEPRENGIHLTERVVISGPLARLVGPLLRRKLEALFAKSVAYVASIAENAGAGSK